MSNFKKKETLEHKILELLRKGIGVEIGEEFEVYQRGIRQWTCRFDKNGFARITENGKSVSFDETWVWKYIADNFDKLEFKRKPFFPKKEKPYFYVKMRLDNNGKAIYNGVNYTYWYGRDFDIAMLITNNYFKTEEEAEDNKEKVIEKMNSLLRAEYE